LQPEKEPVKKMPSPVGDDRENATQIVSNRSVLVNTSPGTALSRTGTPLLLRFRPISPGCGTVLAHIMGKRKKELKMTIFDIARLLSTMAAGLFLIGLVTFATGVAVLVIRSIGQDTRTISKQVSKLAEKGIAEDISGLVGNASSLLSATSELIKTTRGIGVFLIISGALFMLLGIGLTLYIGLS
jgi:hypothetical protein